MDQRFHEWATALLDERERRQPFLHGAKSRSIPDLAAAYGVQDRLVELLGQREESTVAGYKIGLTSKRMQEMCGLDQPIAGRILGSRIYRSGVTLDLARYGRLGLECEIAVRLGHDLPAGDGPFDFATVASAVEAVCPAFEVVDDRNADYRALDLAELIADDCWNAGAVLGEFRGIWPDLASIPGMLVQDNQVIDRGHGGEVLGHPFHALLWLANKCSAEGRGLSAGQVVLTGSLMPTKFPVAGNSYRFDLGMLGSVEADVLA